MDVLYLETPHLPVQVERRKRPELADGRPVVVGGRPWDPGSVLDACPRALAVGIEPGMRLAQAAARFPGAHFLPADHEAYQVAHQQLEYAIRQFTDRIETVGVGSFFVNTSDLGRLFPMREDLAHRFLDEARRESSLDLCVGMADQRFAAQQAALSVHLNHVFVVPVGQSRAFLSPLPLHVLPAEAELSRRLELLGIHTLGALAALPRLAVIHQFGPQAGTLHDLASGRDTRPVHPDAPPLELRKSRTFIEPVRDFDRLAAWVAEIAKALADTLGRSVYQAQGMRLCLEDELRRTYVQATSIEPPTADAARLIRCANDLLTRQSLSRPIIEVSLAIFPLRPAYLGASQLALFDAARDRRWADLAEALRRIRQRFGELAVIVASLLRSPRPREIQVTLAPDGVPCALIWSDKVRAVRKVYEHWRERRFWWGEPLRRDYYRLEDVQGRTHVIYYDLVAACWMLDRRYL